MADRPVLRPRLVSTVLAGVVLSVGLLGSAASSDAQGLPRPSRLVPEIDLKCHEAISIDGIAGLDVDLKLHHLNPILQRLGLPPEDVIVRGLEQLCVPVIKDGRSPPPAVRLFVQEIDLACYKIEVLSPPVTAQLRLSHLNPVIIGHGAPDEIVQLSTPRQLCLPVAKNGRFPNDQILRFIEFLDLKCYDIIQLNDPPTPLISLRLTHINPQFAGVLPDEGVTLGEPEQLCVPVQKNDRRPPDDVLQVLQWIDLKKYRIAPDSDIPLPTLTIEHLNPLLRGRRHFIGMGPLQHLAVPVAKNGQRPTP